MFCLWHRAGALWIESVGLAWCPWLRPCSGCVMASSNLPEASSCGCVCVSPSMWVRGYVPKHGLKKHQRSSVNSVARASLVSVVCLVAEVVAAAPLWVMNRSAMASPSIPLGTGWAARISRLQVWSRRPHWSRPLRVASDCTGSGNAETSFHKLVQDLEVIFTCDHEPAVQHWMRAHMKAKYMFGDIMDRKCNVTSISGTTCEGVVVSINRGDVDVYTAGFPCTPWSGKGLRLGWLDPNAKPLLKIRKTIFALQPPLVILENVPGVLNNGGLHVLKKFLGILKNYHIWVSHPLSPHSFGVPQHRNRIYIVMMKQSSLKFPDMSLHHFELFLTRFLEAVSMESVEPWPDWLAAMGCPMIRDVYGSPEEEVPCPVPFCCTPEATCNVHLCKCPECKRGTLSKCKWRVSHRRYKCSVAYQSRVRAFLRVVRKVKGDKTVRAPDSYFQQAHRARLRVGAACLSPSKRSLLHLCSQERLLMKKTVIMDISQSLGRSALRDDGLTPTLSCGCTQMFAPYFGCSLTMQQCMTLQGMRPTDYDLECLPATDVFRLVGNAMCIPVVGSVFAAALSLLQEE